MQKAVALPPRHHPRAKRVGEATDTTIQLAAGGMDIPKAAKIEPGVGCIKDVKVFLLQKG